jgi:Zn finger protein HypA/HybF involved in hydrogenase expression
MAVRTIRCGRCRYEFIIGGVSETTCPQCGARNRIPSGPAPAGPGPIVDTTAAGDDASEAIPEPGDPRWLVCPACSYRFAVGEVEAVSCPLCSTSVPL